MPTGPYKHSRAISLVEALLTSAVGDVVAVAMQIPAFPLLGFDESLQENLTLGGLFTIVSVCPPCRVRADL